jgi:uncharacterized protein (AIM24 family)
MQVQLRHDPSLTVARCVLAAEESVRVEAGAMIGAVDIMHLEAGEVVTIGTGRVVAHDLAVRFQMRRAVPGRTIASMKSGEGWVFDFTGLVN